MLCSPSALPLDFPCRQALAPALLSGCAAPLLMCCVREPHLGVEAPVCKRHNQLGQDERIRDVVLPPRGAAHAVVRRRKEKCGGA
jgi:hypothetical protein